MLAERGSYDRRPQNSCRPHLQLNSLAELTATHAHQLQGSSEMRPLSVAANSPAMKGLHMRHEVEIHSGPRAKNKSGTILKTTARSEQFSILE